MIGTWNLSTGCLDDVSETGSFNLNIIFVLTHILDYKRKGFCKVGFANYSLYFIFDIYTF